MKKRIIITVVLVAAFCGISPVKAGEIIDVLNGNGIRIYATPSSIKACIDFSKNEPDGSKQGLIKYSIPYDNPQSDGYLYAKGGELFEAHLSYSDNPDLVAVATVGPGGKGPICWDFPNPSKAGLPPVEMVLWVVLKGTKNQYISPPWESKRLYFARADARHPKATRHSIAFAVSGDQLYDVVEKAAAKGWKPAYYYWLERGAMGVPAWGLENLMSGQAPPADTVKK